MLMSDETAAGTTMIGTPKLGLVGCGAGADRVLSGLRPLPLELLLRSSDFTATAEEEDDADAARALPLPVALW